MAKTILQKGAAIAAALSVLFLLQSCMPMAAAANDSGTSQTRTAEKISLSYIYFGSPDSYVSAVERSGDSLNTVSPNYFNLNADGSLQLTPAAEIDFVAAMHARGIAVVPFLSNHWDQILGQAAIANRAALAREIAAAVNAYGLDGVNVDIENLTPTERDGNTDFLRLLREAMPDKIITIAVASNPWGSDSGWAGSYDYAALARYCDYLMLMAYDEHYQGDPNGPGPVASLSFVQKSLDYALRQVPADQLVLGLAFYGRIWRNGGGYPQGYGLSNETVAALVAKYGGSVVFDPTSRSPYAVITVKASDEKPVVGGTKLTAGTYTIWFENEASIQAKLELVGSKGLLGAGSWALGQETADTWNYYKLWLNGCYLGDIETHWARDSIFLAWQNGWMGGLSPSVFSPGGALTRAQAAAILSRALGLASAAGTSFTDTAGHWASAEIEAVHAAGLMNGVGDGRFAPDAPMTREQMAALLRRILGHTIPDGAGGSVSFPDVDAAANAWSYEAVAAMSASGLLLGFPDGTFRPGEAVTRGQTAVLMERLSVQYGLF